MIFLRVFALSVLWKGVLGAIEDYTLTVPGPVTAQEGLCVLIPCQFTIEETGEAAESPRGYWFVYGDDSRYDPAVASNDENREIRADTRGRFRLVGDVNQRDCSLRIDDVTKSDERTYYFRYEHRQNSRIKLTYFDVPLRVTVVGLQDKPEIVVQSALIEGTEGQVYCVAPGRCSGMPPTITWNVDLNSVYATSNYSVVNNDGSQSHRSNITFNITMMDNRKQLICTANFSTVGASTRANVTLLIEYKPRLAASNSSSCQSAKNALMCMCVVEANPPPTIEWKINENIIPESFQNGSMQQAFSLHDAIKNSTFIMNISDSASLSITCIFSNKHGRGAQILLSPGVSSASPSEQVSIGAIAGIAVAATLLLVLLVGVSLCVTRKIRKQGNTGSGAMNEASTVDSTYQELQRRQSDTYCELKRD